MTVDLNATVSTSQDGELLAAYLEQLVGQQLVETSKSYGDELILNFGEGRVGNRSPFVLGLRASTVKRSGRASDKPLVVERVQVELVVAGYRLTLYFSDQFTIEVVPSRESSGEFPDIADWELFTPQERILVAGPGPVWQYRSSTAKRAAR
jgi:hypothetical protein